MAGDHVLGRLAAPAVNSAVKLSATAPTSAAVSGLLVYLLVRVVRGFRRSDRYGTAE